MASTIRLLATAACIGMLPLPVQAHHAAFRGTVYRAIRKADLNTIKHLFSESAWKGKEGVVSGEELQQRLKKGKLIPFRPRSNDLLYESASDDKQRSKCLVTFKLRYAEEKTPDEQFWLLAQRVGDDGNLNPKAWRIVRIVNEKKGAECFLGR